LGVPISVDALQVLVGVRAIAATWLQRRPSSPAELAKRVIRGYHITPAGALISDVLADAISGPDRRVIITCPPREGKSTLVAVAGAVYALMVDPDTEIILASYADELAQKHSRRARAVVAEHAELLGFGLSSERTSAGEWRVAGRDGGLLATGIMSGVTGHGTSLLIIDDPVKNMQEADSPTYRRRVVEEFRATLLSRVHPGGSVVVIQTRWNEQDLAGVLLAEEPDRWTHINIPAVAESGVPDALGRVPGAAMTSALGRTPEAFEDIRRSVGSRAWYALFQGVPAAPEGGLVKARWFEDWRLPAPPLAPALTVVGVDPSDSGEGDECGLIAASISSGGRVALIADQSAPLTSDAWARAAVELAVEVGASEIAVESFAARETYTRMVKQAIERAEVDRPIKVTGWPPKGTDRGKGDAVARSGALLQAFEVGTCVLAGVFPKFESQAVAWQSGQHQPDRLAALVVAHDVLVHAVGARWSLAAPPAGSLGAAAGGRRGGPGVAGGVGRSVTSIDDWMRRRVG
jgi:hypothetical protein